MRIFLGNPLFQSYELYKNKSLIFLSLVGFLQKEVGTRLTEKDQVLSPFSSLGVD